MYTKYTLYHRGCQCVLPFYKSIQNCFMDEYIDSSFNTQKFSLAPHHAPSPSPISRKVLHTKNSDLQNRNYQL